VISSARTADISDALLTMTPQNLIDAEQSVYELRDAIATMNPADAAALSAELAHCRTLADSAAALLLQLLEISAGANTAFTGYGTPPELLIGPGVRA
jgi:hypothetical protein